MRDLTLLSDQSPTASTLTLLTAGNQGSEDSTMKGVFCTTHKCVLICLAFASQLQGVSLPGEKMKFKFSLAEEPAEPSRSGPGVGLQTEHAKRSSTIEILPSHETVTATIR